MRSISTHSSHGYVRCPFVAEFYDPTLAYFDRQDISLLVAMASRTGGPVLDIACGTGRVPIPVARERSRVTGMDHSRLMLSRCPKKLKSESPTVRSRVHLVRADMRDFRLGRRYRLALIPYYSFQLLLSVKEQLRCLACIHRHLVPGGRLVLDLVNPDIPRMLDRGSRILGKLGPRFTLADGRIVTRRARFASIDLTQQVLEIESVSYVKHPSGRLERLVDRIRLRYIFRFEAEHLLARAGFRVEEVYADYNRTKFGAGKGGNMILVGVKP